jgi:hypothetical protein
MMKSASLQLGAFISETCCAARLICFLDYPDKSNVCPHCQRVAAFDACHTVQLHPEFKSTVLAAWDQETIVGVGARSGAHSIPMKRSPFEVYLVVFRCQGCGGSSEFHEFRLEGPFPSLQYEAMSRLAFPRH